MDKNALSEILSRNAWYRDLPPSLAEGILREGRLRQVDGGAIYVIGEEPNGIFAVIEGEVRSTYVTPEGRYAVLMIARPGDWFGEAALLDGGNRYTDAYAQGKCAILQISPAAFRRLVHDNVDHYAAFAQILFLHYRRAINFIANLRHEPLPVRLAQRLVSIARTQAPSVRKGEPVTLKVSQADLAETLNISRQSLNKHLKAFERDGLLTVAYASVTLHRLPALRRLAEMTRPLSV